VTRRPLTIVALAASIAGCSGRPTRTPLAVPAEARQCTQFDGAKPVAADARWDSAAALMKREPMWRQRARTISTAAGKALAVPTDEPGVVLGVVKTRVASLVAKNNCTVRLDGDDLTTYALTCENATPDVEEKRRSVEEVVRTRFVELVAVAKESKAVGTASESANYAAEEAKLDAAPREMVDKNDTKGTVSRLNAFQHRIENMCTVEFMRVAALQGLPDSTLDAATGGARKSKETDDPRLFCKQHAEECMLGCAKGTADACYSLFVMFDTLREKETGFSRSVMDRQRAEYRRQAIELYTAECERGDEGLQACKRKAALEDSAN
jgi:hypothetical protein